MIYRLKISLLFYCLCSLAQGQSLYAYSSIGQAGFDQEKLTQAKNSFDSLGSASLMVLHEGNVVISWGDVTRRYMAHSIRKSFLNSVMGIYWDRGQVMLDTTLEDLGIDDIDGLSEQEKKATIQQLLKSTSGIYHPAAYEPRSMKANRPERGSSKPGEVFFYNNWNFNVLHTILEQKANIDFFESFKKEVADPIGMEDLRMEDMRLREEPDLSSHPAYLFKISTRDLARFGQLYLQEGEWNEEQIIPKEWTLRSTEVGNERKQGYGYLWWVDNETFGQPAFYASGLGGHLCFVFPKQQMVIVHRVNTYLNQSIDRNQIFELIGQILDAKTVEPVTNPELVRFNPESPSPAKTRALANNSGVYLGTYSHPFFREIEVFMEGNQLLVRGAILGRFRIFPMSPQTFTVEDIPELPLRFEKATSENKSGTSVTEMAPGRKPKAVVLYY